MARQSTISRSFIGALALIGWCFWFTSAHTTATAPIHVNVNAVMLRSGDLIFRKGPSLESQAVMAVDGGVPFSHVGIVLQQPNKTFVIHVVPGEGGPDLTKIEPIEDYLRPDRAVTASAFRVSGGSPSQIDTAVEAAEVYAQQRIPFDNDYDLTSEDALYCTELVWRAYRRAGIDLVDGQFEQLSNSLIHGPVIWPSSLLRSKYLTPVWEWKAKGKL